MRVSIIIPNYNGERFLGDCLDSLLGQTRPPDRVTVVDNGSRDMSPEIARQHPLHPHLIELSKNHGFAYAINRGIEVADSEMVALLNNDAVADPAWIESGLQAAKQYPGVSMFASLMLQDDDRGRVDSAGDLYPVTGRPRSRGRGEPASDYQQPVEVFSPCAGAAFYRRSLFEEVGGFEESFFAYLEDIDLGFRARARGHVCLYVPNAVVFHRGAATDLGDRQGKKSVDSSERVYWIAGNRIRVIARNWPPGFLIRRLPWLVLGLAQSAGYHALVSKQGGAFLRGAVKGLRQVPRDRKFFRRQRSGHPAGPESTPGHSPWSFQNTARMIRFGVRPWEP